VSAAVTLTWRGGRERVDVEGLTPDACAERSAAEIGSLPAWVGSTRAAVGDFFDVAGERSAHVRVTGDLALVDGLGAGMSTGELVVEGSAGSRLAAGLAGGRVRVRGSVGDDAGLAMSGGVLRITGSAGHRLGAAAPGASRGMTGGEILVEGTAGDDLALRARRGLVVVAGDVGRTAGRSMIAGTLVVGGAVGDGVLDGNKRGSLVALARITVPSTYRLACTYEPPFVRLLMTYLARTHQWPVDAGWRDGVYRRYCGGPIGPGRGEILALVGP
jgi:formylmethanofuran dehydrogenase subunit C